MQDRVASNRPAAWRKLLGLALIALSAIYLVAVFRDDTDGIVAALAKISWWKIAGAVICSTLMCLLKTAYHAHLLRRITGRTELSATIAAAYAQAQVVRYLPGKVWGFLYQANQLSSRFSAQEVMLANVLQMLTTNILAIGIIASVLGSLALRSTLPLLALPAILILVEILHRRPVLEKGLVRLAVAASRGRFGTRGLIDIEVAPSRWLGTLILTSEWIAYFAAWAFLADGLLSLESALTLAAFYAAASLLSILAIAMPAGLVVREAIFVSLGGLASFPQATLVVLATAMRLAMTIGDLLCIPATLANRRFGHDRND